MILLYLNYLFEDLRIFTLQLEKEKLLWWKKSFVWKSLFHRGQVRRIFVFNLNVLQKLTLPAAEKYPQVPGKWQKHFHLNPGRIWDPGIFNPAGARVVSLKWEKMGKGPEIFTHLPPNTPTAQIPQSFMFWLIRDTRFRNHWLLFCWGLFRFNDSRHFIQHTEFLQQ